MSKPRRKAASPVARIATLAVALAAAALLLFLAARLASGALSRVRPAASGGERDPQFAEPAEIVTRPPELMGEGDYGALEGDPSAGWDLGEQTPVDKTADELSREAAEG